MRTSHLPILKAPGDSVMAFTLVEVVVSMCISAIVFGTMISAYIQATRRAEWSGYSLAAQALAVQQLEQARSAVWDPALGKNEVTNLNLKSWTYNSSTRICKGYTYTNLDVPVAGGNVTWATNYITISLLTNVTGTPGVSLQIIRVDTAWPFSAGGARKFYSNTVSTYMAPDNRDVTTL
jgi:type II secretory pathway pseudopilin PulG